MACNLLIIILIKFYHNNAKFYTQILRQEFLLIPSFFMRKRRVEPTSRWTSVQTQAPRLEIGSQRWLLFDPQRRWRAEADSWAPAAANQPLAGTELTGQVLATGLSAELWRLPDGQP